MTEHSNKHWHIKKEFSYGHLLTTISMAFVVLVFGFGLDKRVAILESNSVRYEKQVKANYSGLRDMLIRIEDKLDRKADK